MHLLFSAKTTLGKSTLFALLCVIALAYFALWSKQAQLPKPSKESLAQFPIAAASAQLAILSQEKHPIGSLAHDRVRDYLIAEITALGYHAEVQKTLAISRKGHAAAIVQNILVRIPGRRSAPGNDAAEAGRALLIAAHYDAVPNSYGAGDDGVSVVAILQTLKTLKTETPLSNDLICLFTDGEEAGLLGAEGYVAEHPWMRDVGLVLNFDNRGNSGPTLMFETSANNGKLIDHFAQALPKAISNSVMGEVYKALPNDTDLTVFKRAQSAQIPGLNFAHIGNIASYHTRYDRAALFEPAAQFEQGESLLQLVRHFGRQDLSVLAIKPLPNADTADQIYFDLPLVGLIHYSSKLALPVTLLCCALAIYAFLRTRLSTPLTLIKTGVATVIFLMSVVGLALIVQFSWLGLEKILPDYTMMRDPDPGHFYLWGLIILSTLIFGKLQIFLSRRWSFETQFFAAIVLCLSFSILSCVRAPGASFLLSLPAASMLLAAIAIEQCKLAPEHPARLWIWLLGASFGIVLLLPFILLVNIALGFHLSAVPILLLLLLLGLTTPLLQIFMRRLRLSSFFLVALLCLGLGGVYTHRFYEKFPIPSQLIYALDSEHQNAYWLSPNLRLQKERMPVFSEQVSLGKMPELFGENHPRATWDFWHEKAAVMPLAQAKVELLHNMDRGEECELELKIQSASGATSTQIMLENSPVLRAYLNDKVLSEEKQLKFSVNLYALPAEGVRLKLQLPKIQAKGQAAHLRSIDSIYLPQPAALSALAQSASTDFVAHNFAQWHFDACGSAL